MWPTAVAQDVQNVDPQDFLRRKGRKPDGAITSLNVVAYNWPTPCQNLYEGVTPESFEAQRDKTGAGVRNLHEEAAHWATPNAHDGRRPGSDQTSTQGANLKRDAEVWEHSHPAPATPAGPPSCGSGQTSRRHWQTPKDVATGANQRRGGDRKDELLLTGQAAEFMGNQTKRLNPRFVEWLLGLPIGWTEL